MRKAKDHSLVPRRYFRPSFRDGPKCGAAADAPCDGAKQYFGHFYASQVKPLGLKIK
jgi:hypothetical protein